MRFMIIVKGTPADEQQMPSPELIAAMGKYNEELINAGVMLAGEGLAPSAQGAHVKFLGGGKISVIDGPFSEAKEILGGFWIIDVKSREEALEWVRRIPFEDGEIELRKVAEVSDFPADSISEDALAKEQAWRDANQKPITR